MTMFRKLLFLLSVAVLPMMVNAKVVLPQLFQSGMVLQRGKPIPVWGKAAPHERINIKWQKRQYAVQAGADGRWRVDLPQMKAGGPYVLEVSGEDQEALTIQDVLVGDVWLCSGQSNVDVTIERVYPQYPAEIDRFDNNRVRLFRVPNVADPHGVRDDIAPTQWKPLNKENAWGFSALGTFLGIRMQLQTGVPQGIIVNSWGGTPIEAWLSADSLQRDYPLELQKTRLYQDDKLVEAQRVANERAGNRWFQLLNETDPGVQQQWTSEQYNDQTWPEINQYGDIAGQQYGNYVGSLWLRQHLYINKEHAGKPARLLLGTLFDQDYTYVNGREVGRTYYQYPPRRYQVPEGLLHEGDNVLTVRFVNKYGIPHFIKEKPYMLIFGDGDTLQLSEQWKVSRGALMPPCPSGDVSLQNMATTLYNAVLYPLAPYALSGVVWYQGETNAGNPAPYADLLRKLLGNWRTLWQAPQLPFCVVQLANYMAPSAAPQNSSWARLREAQRMVANDDPNAELACIIDLGETVDIHPLRKKEVAERVGLCMDRLVYHKRVQLSPQPVSFTCDGAVVELTFDQPLRPCAVQELEIAGEDGRYVNVEATAKGNQVTLKSPVSSPKSIRYAWKDNPLRANLYSLGGLPATPFEMPLR